MIARHVFVSGRVQGVGYRDWLVAAATAQGLAGWVRNLRDGRVEALLAGPEAAVAAAIAACHDGPRLARVDDIQATPADLPDAPGFRRLPTA